MNDERWLVSRALTGSGPAILAFIADHEDGVEIVRLGSEMADSGDWIALARLLAAGLIDEDGVAVSVTDLGESIAAEYVAMAASR
jgi:hypothetical protein